MLFSLADTSNLLGHLSCWVLHQFRQTLKFLLHSVKLLLTGYGFATWLCVLPKHRKQIQGLLLFHFSVLLLLTLLLWWISEFCWSYLLMRFPSHKPVCWRTSCHVCIEKPHTKSCFSSVRAFQSRCMFMNGLCFCISWKMYERCHGNNFLFIVLFASRHFLLSAKNYFCPVLLSLSSGLCCSLSVLTTAVNYLFFKLALCFFGFHLGDWCEKGDWFQIIAWHTCIKSWL